MQADAVVDVPVVAVEDDVVLVLLAGQHRRQHDPVVVAVRLVAEDGDPELLAAAALEHLLDEPGAGHAVADDDQPRAGVEVHVVEVDGRQAFDAASQDRGHQTSTSPRSTTSSPVTPSGAAACSSTTHAAGQVLDHPERHVVVALRPDREPAHRLAVAQEQHVDELAGGVAAAEVQRLGRLPGRHGVAQRGVERAGLGQALPGDREDALQEAGGALHAGAPRCGAVRGQGLGGGGWSVRNGAGLGGGGRGGDVLVRAADAGDGDGADLEGRHPAGRVQRRVGEGVGAGAAAPVEGREDDVGPHGVRDVGVEPGAAAAGGQLDDVVRADAEAAGQVGVQLGPGGRRDHRRGCGSRRVWVPDWYCAITRPVVRTYGYSASGRSWASTCSTRRNRARPSGVANRSANSRGVPGWSVDGHGQKTPSSASMRS